MKLSTTHTCFSSFWRRQIFQLVYKAWNCQMLDILNTQALFSQSTTHVLLPCMDRNSFCANAIHEQWTYPTCLRQRLKQLKSVLTRELWYHPSTCRRLSRTPWTAETQNSLNIHEQSKPVTWLTGSASTKNVIDMGNFAPPTYGWVIIKRMFE